ncbi:MAG: Rab family GTPase [Promethearchaeota archaeon]
MFDLTFKLLMTGDGGVGKTTLTQRFVTGLFTESTRITIGVDFHTKDVEVDGHRVKLQIWDFGGEERFRFLLPSYCRGAAGALFLFSITSYTSLSHMPEWLQIVRENAPGVPILLVGSKRDLEKHRAVPTSDAVEYARGSGLAGYVEVSAKDGTNVEETFTTITRLMIERHQQAGGD